MLCPSISHRKLCPYIDPSSFRKNCILVEHLLFVPCPTPGNKDVFISKYPSNFHRKVSEYCSPRMTKHTSSYLERSPLKTDSLSQLVKSVYKCCPPSFSISRPHPATVSINRPPFFLIYRAQIDL